jgi:putative sterol carrier protein
MIMSDTLNEALAVLNEKLAGSDFAGSAKFDVEGEGAIVIDASGARVADEETDVTLSADADTFRSILEGETNPTSAFMTGKLKVDGDMGMAMQLANVLA